MKRYVTCDDWLWYSYIKAADSLARTVHESDGTPRDTKLLDAAGNKLYAVEDRKRVGFVWFGGGA